jgi:hypothetical protein
VSGAYYINPGLRGVVAVVVIFVVCVAVVVVVVEVVITLFPLSSVLVAQI